MSAPPRLGLAVTCLGHAAVFSWAATALPWRSGTTFSITLALLAILHVSTALSVFSRKATWLLWSWRALSLASAVTFVGFTWSLCAAALYVSKLYIRLGPPVAGGITAAAIALGLLTLPIAVWGALVTLPAATRVRRKLGAGAGLLIAIAVLSLPVASSAALGDPIAHTDAELIARLSDELDAHVQGAPLVAGSTVAGAGPAECQYPVNIEQPTLLVAYVRRGKARSECLQASTSTKLRRKLRRLLRRTEPGSTVVIDLVRTLKPLSPTFPLLDALELRPGIDGVCEDTLCLPAWQLTLSDSFSDNRPLPAIPDASYGFSADAVRHTLGSKQVGRGLGIGGLVRIETESLVADVNGVHRLVRTRTTPPALSRISVSEAVEAAQRYIVAAQERDGSFRYALDPATGKADEATMNLPRQAGTTYALCELGHGAAVRRAVRLALDAFEPTETKLGELSVLSNDGTYALGRSALPLLAMLRCRELSGARNDRLIGQLSRLMLKMQREDGSFFPELDPKSKRGAGEHEAVYAAGQAVLALVLLEQQLTELKGSEAEPLPKPTTLKSALDRAMSYYGGQYWPTPLRDFFFFEEGWHCLAARTALSSHRNDAYEQLCIDYVASRARFILRQSDTSEPNFVGGYGISDLFPPRNTATAGVGEALNASISIKLKRGLPVDEDKALLRDLVTFLLRAQWTRTGCYACRSPEEVAGGFSQQLASPSIRIDYVQHAMAAIGHGSKLLGLLD
jgi:hypothetical protein